MHKLTDLAAPAAATIDFDQFMAVDIRAGTIVAVDPFPEARKPAWKLTIDFGPTLGRKRSSAQVVHHYDAAALLGRKVAAVVNLPPRQIGPMLSEVLVLGFPDEEGHVLLVSPDMAVPNGARLF